MMIFYIQMQNDELSTKITGEMARVSTLFNVAESYLNLFVYVYAGLRFTIHVAIYY